MKLLTKVYKIIAFKLKKKINLDKKKINLNNLNNIFNHFGTDKGSKVSNPYTKNINKDYLGHGFSKYYEKHFKNLKGKKINVLEIGVWKGASTASFFYYLSKANFYAIDRNFKFNYYSKRIKFIYCDTSSHKDLVKLKEYFQKNKLISFDIIIDDGGHQMNQQIKSFEILYDKVKNNGVYLRLQHFEVLNTEIRSLLFKHSYGYDLAIVDFGKLQAISKEATINLRTPIEGLTSSANKMPNFDSLSI
jgi:hypothetical protein